MKNREDGRLVQILKSSKMCSTHKDKKVWARGMCKNCYNTWLKAHNPDYADKQKKNCENWTKDHVERIKQYKKDYVAKKDPSWRWAISLKFRFNITPQDYESMLSKQDGKCAICRKSPTNKRLAVDHCHETGKIRGLLCFRCNFGLSYFAESADTLERATVYLRQ